MLAPLPGCGRETRTPGRLCIGYGRSGFAPLRFQLPSDEEVQYLQVIVAASYVDMRAVQQTPGRDSANFRSGDNEDAGIDTESGSVLRTDSTCKYVPQGDFRGAKMVQQPVSRSDADYWDVFTYRLTGAYAWNPD